MLNKLGFCLRLQFRIMLNQSAGRLGNRKKRTKNGFVVLIAGLLIYLSVYYSLMLLNSFPPGYESLLILLMSLAGVSMVFFVSIQLAQGTLFAFRDFDFLMALPVSRAVIMISKIVSFLLICYGYCGFIFLPAAVLYGVHVSAGFSTYLIVGVGFLFLPLIPMALSSILALAIRILAGRSRWQSLVSNLMSFALFLIVFAGSMALSFSSEGLIAIEPDRFLSQLTRFLPFVGWYAKAVIETNYMALAGSVLMSAGAFGLFVALFNKTFIRVNSNLQEGYHVRNYRLKRLKRQGIFQTLFKKELKKFLSNFMYVMNMAIGQILLAVGAIYVLLNKDEFLTLTASLPSLQAQEVTSSIFTLVVALILFFGLMSNTAAVSLSLEGKNFWILRSLPIRPEECFMAKVAVNAVVIILPSWITLLLSAVAFDFTIWMILEALSVIVALGFFVGMLGLMINLLFPRLDFDREILVIKQSAASFIAVLGGVLLGIACFYLLFQGAARIEPLLLVGGVGLGFVLLDLILWRLLTSLGVRLFNKL